MSVLGIESIVRGFHPDLVYPQAMVPFRFSVSDRMGLMGGLGWDTHKLNAQRGEHIDQILEYVTHTLSAETGESTYSQSRITHAAVVLPDLAWHAGSHLSGVVTCAGGLLEGFALKRVPLLVGEFGASALKNAAFHSGPHVTKVIEIALEHGFSNRRNSPRINDGCVRAILSATRHSRDLLRSLGDVEGFLLQGMADANPAIARNAHEARSIIFG